MFIHFNYSHLKYLALQPAGNPSIRIQDDPSVQFQGINDAPDGKGLAIGREIGGILVRDLLVGLASQQARGRQAVDSVAAVKEHDTRH